MSTMYKKYEEYWINLTHKQFELPCLYTTHFEKKIKPGLNTYLIYYYRVDYYNILFYITFNV
jgi:hypothetical protein